MLDTQLRIDWLRLTVRAHESLARSGPKEESYGTRLERRGAS